MGKYAYVIALIVVMTITACATPLRIPNEKLASVSPQDGIVFGSI
jgi:hypothetical protein